MAATKRKTEREREQAGLELVHHKPQPRATIADTLTVKPEHSSKRMNGNTTVWIQDTFKLITP